MSVRQAFTSLLQLFTVFFFFAAGLFFIALSRSETLRLLCENWMWNERSAIATLGCGFLIGAAVLLAGFYGIQRGRSLRIRMGTHLAEIDPLLIRQMLESHFRGNFPKPEFYDVEIGTGGRIEIAVSFKAVPEEASLEGMEKELGALLRNRFGYAKPFHLLVRI